MTSGKEKLLPKIIIGAAKNEVDLEANHNLEYSLKLLDNNGQHITSFKAVDGDTRAILTIHVTHTQNSQFPDPDG
jgi:hypothetical protein